MDTITRFDQTVPFYDAYRPDYPSAVMDLLTKKSDLKKGDAVADVGAGTGKFTSLLLARDLKVYSVEPNDAMRGVAEKKFADNANFVSIKGTSDATTLGSHSVKLITAAQAFHWFQPIKTRAEFARILAPQGYVALIWNIRNKTASPFMQAYDNLMAEFGTNYDAVNADNFDISTLAAFFAPCQMETIELANQQLLDWTGAKGRLESISYVPKQNQPHYETMMQQFQKMVEAFQEHGKVTFVYKTMVHFGRLDS